MVGVVVAEQHVDHQFHALADREVVDAHAGHHLAEDHHALRFQVDRGNGDEVWVYRISTGNSGGGGLLPRGTSVSVGTGSPGYPGGGYPGSYPGGYPSGGGSGVYIPPIVLGGGGGGYEAPVLEDQIVFRNGRVTHGDGVK